MTLPPPQARVTFRRKPSSAFRDDEIGRVLEANPKTGRVLVWWPRLGKSLELASTNVIVVGEQGRSEGDS